MKRRAETPRPRKPATRRRASRPPGKREPLGRQAWLDAARTALIEEGTAGIEVNKLAKRLGSSRGGFYWFFTSRQQLLDELVAYWANTSTAPFEELLKTHGRNGIDAFRALTNLWVDERDYDPKWDGAVRDWARTSEAIHDIVATVDNKRIALLEQIFTDMGYQGKEAHIRARITYYHQVGYYAMGVKESRQARRELFPFYEKVLTGRSP